MVKIFILREVKGGLMIQNLKDSGWWEQIPKIGWSGAQKPQEQVSVLIETDNKPFRIVCVLSLSKNSNNWWNNGDQLVLICEYSRQTSK